MSDKEINSVRLLIEKWREIGAKHGVRHFTGNDHLLFANELEAVLSKAQSGDKV